jgi:SAM-dependent methyltransferase
LKEIDPRWYRRSFGRTWLDRFALRLERPESVVQAADFIVEKLALGPSARIFDLACGHGRHSLELARRGYSVVGLDISPESIEIARERAASERLEVEFLEGDMREIPFRDEFDAVINMNTAFGYLETQEDDQRVLDGIAVALRTGGRLLMEIVNPVSLFRNYQSKDWEQLEDGTLFLQDRNYDIVRGRNDVTWRFLYPDGSEEQMERSIRLYTLPELIAMYAASGLQFSSAWGGVDGSELSIDTRRMVVIGVKSRD